MSNSRFTFRLVSWKVSIVFLTSFTPSLAAVPATRDYQPDDLVAEAWLAVNDGYYDATFGGANWEQIAGNFVHRDYDNVVAAHQAIRQMLSLLKNPSTRFLESPQASAMIAELGGELGSGIGLIELLSADVDEEEGGIVIVTPVPDTPAARSGIRTGDRLLSVDNVPVETRALADVMSMLRGPAGTDVEIDFQRGDRVLRVVVPREELGSINSVDSRTVSTGELSVGIIRISLFDASASGDVLDGIDRLRDSGVDGIVLDLRNNPGGSLTALYKIAGAFLGPLPLARVTAKDGIHTLVADGTRQMDLPVVVLINEGTASAAEVLASALRYHDRAVLVGANTFGKGLVHGFVSLSDSSGVMFTAGRIESLDGADILTEGVLPDIEIQFEPHPVVDSNVDALSARDIEFARAVEVIRRGLAAP